ncbi:MAG: nuclease-related domain-containing protein [Bacteroidetes bacterium]|nr:nuclease-related domain-containing protein [Bacteroidota bacterium]
MAREFGKIESLKKLRQELNAKNITRFNSLSEIDYFLKNYQKEKDAAIAFQKESIKNEIEILKASIEKNKLELENLKANSTEKTSPIINYRRKEIENLRLLTERSFMHKITFGLILKFQEFRLYILRKNFQDNHLSKVWNIETQLSKDIRGMDLLLTNGSVLAFERSDSTIKKLDYIKKTVDDLYFLVSGAIGEDLVVKEISKLSDDFVLINDFSLEFNPPIFNKNENDRIYSIQVDHLLVSTKGIFILETKNWSKKSIDSLDLRSPVKQVKRTSLALYIKLNEARQTKEIRMDKHHWGDKKIPIRNVIVMINERPKEEFDFVKIKTLKELNSYINYGVENFSLSEFNMIITYLLKTQGL